MFSTLDFPSPESRSQSYQKIPALIEAVRQACCDIKMIPKKKRSFDNTIGALAQAQHALNDHWQVLDHLQKVLRMEELEDIEQVMTQKITELYSDLLFDKGLMELYEALLKNLPDLTEDQKSLIEQEIASFTREGINLPKEQQQRLRDISEKIAELCAKFDRHVQSSTDQWVRSLTEAEMASIPAHIHSSLAEVFNNNKELFPGKINGYAITLAHEHIHCILSECSDASLRHDVFIARSQQCTPLDQVNSAFDNTAISQRIVELSKEKALILGYASMQHYQLEERFSNQPSQIDKLQSKVLPLLTQAASEEFELITQFAASKGHGPLKPWDLSYFIKEYERENFDIDWESLRAFFPLEHVLSTMLDHFSQLYDVHFIIDKDTPSWHPDSFVLRVINGPDGVLLGPIYCDLFTRAKKDQGAWMSEVRPASFNNGQWEEGAAFLCCNFRPGEPALLIMDDIETLFHETGHCLHHLLSRKSLRDLSGLGDVPMDIVELPSQLQERWCYEPHILQKMSNGLLPPQTQEKIIASQNNFKGLLYLRQARLGMFDWELYSAEGSSNFEESWEKTKNKVKFLNNFDGGLSLQTFQHIITSGYDAGYYSYLHADLYVAQVFEKFKQYPSIQEAGRAFRKAFLEKGADPFLKDSLEKEFLGSPQQIEPFITSIGYEKLITLKESPSKALSFTQEEGVTTRAAFKRKQELLLSRAWNTNSVVPGTSTENDERVTKERPRR